MNQSVEIANDLVSPANQKQPPRATVWLPVVIWGILIFGMSTSSFSSFNTSRFIEPMLRWIFPIASAATISVLHALIRKTAHFVEYGVLFWLLVRGPMAGRPYTAFALCVLYALTDEGHQIFVDGRTPSLYDVALDSTGALFSRFLNLAVAELA
jgi:VanZ family protein